MFLTDCPTCGLRELRGARSIELLVNTDAGIELAYRCRACDAINLVGGTAQPLAAVPSAA